MCIWSPGSRVRGAVAHFSPSKRLLVPVVLAFVLLVRVRPAEAYIDPGSTNIMLQGVIGGVAAVIVVVGAFWRRMLGALGTIFRHAARSASEQNRRGGPTGRDDPAR